MSAPRGTRDQVTFYDGYYRREVDLPVERLKRETRLMALARLGRGSQGERALIVGCGRGEEVAILEAGRIVALDLSLTGVQAARQAQPGAAYCQADGTRLPFGSGSFDALLCSEVIEHVLDPPALVSEFARVLRPGGTLILSTPNWISWWGLARLIGRMLTGRDVTSGGQPVDRWFTTVRLRRVLSPHFEIVERRGVWYYPPTGLGYRRLPDGWLAPLMRRLMPINDALGRIVPGLGHLHALRAVVTHARDAN